MKRVKIDSHSHTCSHVAMMMAHAAMMMPLVAIWYDFLWCNLIENTGRLLKQVRQTSLMFLLNNCFSLYAVPEQLESLLSCFLSSHRVFFWSNCLTGLIKFCIILKEPQNPDFKWLLIWCKFSLTFCFFLQQKPAQWRKRWKGTYAIAVNLLVSCFSLGFEFEYWLLTL